MADTLDVLTIAEARTALGLTGTTASDTPLALAVTAVSRQVDELCGPVVKRTHTAETHDGGGYTIRLRHRPVHTVTTVTEYDGTTATTLTAESNTAKPASGYLHDGRTATLNSGLIRRRASNADITFAEGRRNIAVTYDAGRAATTADADAKFKEAAAMMLRNVWTAEMASGSETFGAFTDQQFNPLLGPGLLNKVVAILQGEIIDGTGFYG